MPEGSIQTGFSRTAPVNGQAFGYLNYGAGFVACPPAAANATEGYQVYGATTNATTFGPECLGFSALSGEFALVCETCARAFANVCLQ
jgi:hypothetical protein